MNLLPFRGSFHSAKSPLSLGNERKASSERLRFQGRGSSGPDVDTVEFSATTQAQPPESHQQRLQRLQRHAQTAARLAPNYSGRHYAALVKLADGTEGISANVEASRQLTLCDLRLAIGAAQNQWIQKQSQQQGQAPSSLPPVKTIYLVSANLKDDHSIPCADCQEWLASPICPPDVSVVSLEKNAAGDFLIRQRTVREMLPLYKGRSVFSKTDRALAELPVAYSALATTQPANLADSLLSKEAARDLMGQAQAAYRHNLALAKDSKAPTGVAMLLHPSGRLITGARVDWSTRWHVPADLATVAAGLTRNPQALADGDESNAPPEKIQAVAYYGDDSQLPPITSLGRIARNRGSAETRILTIEDNTIQVRTIKDFLPELYRDGKSKAN